MDEKERRYRINHALRVTKGSVRYTFGQRWVSRHINIWNALFNQRREQIIGDNVQLEIDVDVYDEMVEGKHAAIQPLLDYTDDVAEREALMSVPNKNW